MYVDYFMPSLREGLLYGERNSFRFIFKKIIFQLCITNPQRISIPVPFGNWKENGL
jgi:hypothetical protein